jgi:hypothetical protein
VSFGELVEATCKKELPKVRLGGDPPGQYVARRCKPGEHQPGCTGEFAPKTPDPGMCKTTGDLARKACAAGAVDGLLEERQRARPRNLDAYCETYALIHASLLETGCRISEVGTARLLPSTRDQPTVSNLLFFCHRLAESGMVTRREQQRLCEGWRALPREYARTAPPEDVRFLLTMFADSFVEGEGE